MEKINELKLKLEQFQAKSAAKEEIKAFVALTLQVLKRYKDSFDALSAENISTIKECVSYLEKYNQEHTDTLDAKINTATVNIESKISELKALIAKVQTIKPVDGIDGVNPDPEEVVPLVLAKLPKVEPFTLKRTDVIQEINTGKKDDVKIELNQIEGTDKLEKGILDRAVSILDQRTKFLVNKNVKHDNTLTGSGTDADPLSVVGGSGAVDSVNGQTGVVVLDTGDITEATDANYVSDAQLVVIGNTSGTNSGDVTLAGEDFLSLTGQQITANPIDLDNLSATGTPSSSTFLRGDNTWATPAGSGDVSKVGTPVNNQVGVWTGDGTLEGDADLTFDTATNTLATGIVTVSDEAYGAGWNGSLQVPTKNAIYDKIEGLSAVYAPVLGADDNYVTDAEKVVIGNTSGTNTGDQTSIVGITGTKAEFNTAVSDGNIMYVGDAPTAHTHTKADLTDIADFLLESEVDADIKTLSLPASTTISTFGASIIDDANEATFKATVNLEIGIDVQAYDADLTTLATAFSSASVSGPASLAFHEDTDNGTNKVTIIAPASVASDKTITLPDATGTLALTSDITGTNSNTNTGDQTITNSSDATSHTVTLSASGGTIQFIEGTNISLTTGGTASAGTLTITASGGSGDVTKVGTPANNQIGIWTGDGTLEGDANLTYDGTSFNLATAKNFQIAGATVLSDSAGTTTLSNIDALDATTEATIEGAIDTLANLTSIQGRTVTLADAGADALLGWDDSASAYQNLSAADAKTALALNNVTNDAQLPLAGGTMTGNITLGENASVDLDPALSADGKYSGICITGTAGATLAFGDLIYLAVADSRWELADADAATTADRMLGICVLAAAADGNATKILLHGNIRADAAFPTLTVGAAVYVGETAGDVQVAIPTGADNIIRRVGYALTADELYFCPSMDSQSTVA